MIRRPYYEYRGRYEYPDVGCLNIAKLRLIISGENQWAIAMGWSVAILSVLPTPVILFYKVATAPGVSIVQVFTPFTSIIFKTTVYIFVENQTQFQTNNSLGTK